MAQRVTVNGLIWDDWNLAHICKHNVSKEEVERVCHGKHKIIESYRKRVQISGVTNRGRKLIIILSPEDRNLKVYGKDIYYVITAFEEV